MNLFQTPNNILAQMENIDKKKSKKSLFFKLFLFFNLFLSDNENIDSKVTSRGAKKQTVDTKEDDSDYSISSTNEINPFRYSKPKRNKVACPKQVISLDASDPNKIFDVWHDNCKF